ncbi:hypothetical protein CHH69_06525, partial [Terribacillus saccharophilus]
PPARIAVDSVVTNTFLNMMLLLSRYLFLMQQHHSMGFLVILQPIISNRLSFLNSASKKSVLMRNRTRFIGYETSNKQMSFYLLDGN